MEEHDIEDPFSSEKKFNNSSTSYINNIHTVAHPKYRMEEKKEIPRESSRYVLHLIYYF